MYSELRRTFITAGTGICSSDCKQNATTTVHLHECTSCNKLMCAKCVEGHTVEFCNTQRKDEVSVNDQGGKQSEIHCRPDMVPLATLKIAEVCDTGNKKYDKENPMLDTIGSISPNWHKITAREHLNHVIYHIQKAFAGDTSCEEHIAHAACRAMFALEMHLREPKLKMCPKCVYAVYYDAVEKHYRCSNCSWKESQAAGV